MATRAASSLLQSLSIVTRSPCVASNVVETRVQSVFSACQRSPSRAAPAGDCSSVSFLYLRYSSNSGRFFVSSAIVSSVLPSLLMLASSFSSFLFAKYLPMKNLLLFSCIRFRSPSTSSWPTLSRLKAVNLPALSFSLIVLFAKSTMKSICLPNSDVRNAAGMSGDDDNFFVNSMTFMMASFVSKQFAGMASGCATPSNAVRNVFRLSSSFLQEASNSFCANGFHSFNDRHSKAFRLSSVVSSKAMTSSVTAFRMAS